MKTIVERCCGLDVHQAVVVAWSWPASRASGRAGAELLRVTADLAKLRE